MNIENDIEILIESFEISAIYRGDMVRAIRYNWLRNAVKVSQIQNDNALHYLSVIHSKEPNEWPALNYNQKENVA